MSIKFNEFGEVISVNGITTGQHIGTPIQDALAELPEHNQAYSEEVFTVTSVENTIVDAQPTQPGSGSSGSGGSSVASVSEKDVNFYDYDGTCLYAYTVKEAQALSELPPLPERKGLVCQGWNWSLEDIKEYNNKVIVGAMYDTDDGTTRIYITLQEGRTSPMLGVCPNGTVTVDWGDGTEPDVLTGTSVSTVKWTPTHNYAKHGDYVIRLTVDGTVGFLGVGNAFGAYLLRNSSNNNDTINRVYLSAIKKIELGSSAYIYNQYALNYCCSLKSINIPYGLTNIGESAFSNCSSLPFISIPNSIERMGSMNYAFSSCHKLSSVSLPSNMVSMGTYTFKNCEKLSSITPPRRVTSIGSYVICNCQSLTSVVVPNTVTAICSWSFTDCKSLASIKMPSSVDKLQMDCFAGCSSMKFIDFTNHTKIPVLEDSGAFSGCPSDFEIRVPAALYNEWIAATNWSTYANRIVAV